MRKERLSERDLERTAEHTVRKPPRGLFTLVRLPPREHRPKAPSLPGPTGAVTAEQPGAEHVRNPTNNSTPRLPPKNNDKTNNNNNNNNRREKSTNIGATSFATAARAVHQRRELNRRIISEACLPLPRESPEKQGRATRKPRTTMRIKKSLLCTPCAEIPRRTTLNAVPYFAKRTDTVTTRPLGELQSTRERGSLSERNEQTNEQPNDSVLPFRAPLEQPSPRPLPRTT